MRSGEVSTVIGTCPFFKGLLSHEELLLKAKNGLKCFISIGY